MIGSTISHYKIIEQLGEGGMGVVYKAEDLKLERSVALKFLAAHLLNDDEAKARFLREAKAAAALHHPSICPVYEIDEVDGKTFLAMAFLKGETLEDRIAKGPLPLKDALDIARQVAEGLQAAHAEGIVHRDIKPANILVSPEGRATIMDFGLARLTEASKLTRADQTVGTAAYMSPEQMQGGEVDHRSDLWAHGCVLYEMVAGARTFQGEYAQALAYEIVNQAPEPLTAVRSGVPMELEFVVGKCLEKDAASRYQNASEIAVDLRNLQDKLKSGRSTILRTASLATGVPATLSTGQTLSPIEALPSDAVVVRRSRQRLLQILLAVTVVALFGLLFVYTTEAPLEKKPVRRFSFAPPARLDTGRTTAGVAISPNGRHIAFSAAGSLWVQDLDQDEPRRLAGTEGALLPFWSPDSELIAFAAGGELRRISVQGGASGFICPLPSALFYEGTWSPNGESIVFSSGTGGPAVLHEVSSQGGPPDVLVDPAELDEAGRNVSRPRFLPLDVCSHLVLHRQWKQRKQHDVRQELRYWPNGGSGARRSSGLLGFDRSSDLSIRQE